MEVESRFADVEAVVRTGVAMAVVQWENGDFIKGNPRGYIWVNYNELTTSSLEIIVSKGNHPQMALIQVSELL